VKQRKADTKLGQFGVGEFGLQLRAFMGGEWLEMEERVCESKGMLMASWKFARLVPIADLLDEVFGQSVLLRNCEAHVLSKAALGEPSVAHASDFFGRVIDHAMAPERAIEPVEVGHQLGL
jgi:hypothetical protein